MKTTSYYPVLMTGDVGGTKAFYIKHFAFKALFESDWHVHLQSPEDRRAVSYTHLTLPTIYSV